VGQRGVCFSLEMSTMTNSQEPHGKHVLCGDKENYIVQCGSFVCTKKMKISVRASIRQRSHLFNLVSYALRLSMTASERCGRTLLNIISIRTFLGLYQFDSHAIPCQNAFLYFTCFRWRGGIEFLSLLSGGKEKRYRHLTLILIL